MNPTILYNPKNGITMPYDAALADMAPNLVALTDAEYAKVSGGKPVGTAKKESAVPSVAAPAYTIDTVPDAELLAFCRGQGMDFDDLFAQAADDDERAQALKAIRKRAAKDLARLAAAKRKG